MTTQKIGIQTLQYTGKSVLENVDRAFTQLVTPIPETTATPESNVEEFFKTYQNLYYQIPQLGETNSHEYLIKQSSLLVQQDVNQEEALALQAEITQLRQENLELQRTLLNLQQTVS
jgi:hypothetical protein